MTAAPEKLAKTTKVTCVEKDSQTETSNTTKHDRDNTNNITAKVLVHSLHGFVVFCQAFGPLAALYWLATAFRLVRQRWFGANLGILDSLVDWALNRFHIRSTFIRYLLGIEAVWWVFSNTYLIKRISRRSYCEHGPLQKEDRSLLFERCLETAAIEFGSSIEERMMWVRQWHFSVPFERIKKGNVVDWLSYAFLTKHTHELSPEEKEEVDSYVEKCQKKLEIKFPEGFDKDVISMSAFSREPIEYRHRPLSMYFFTDFLFGKVAVPLGLRMSQKGNFKRYSVGKITYYFCPQQSNGKGELREPIVFFHGIGIGVLPYIPWILDFHSRLKEDRSIILVEFDCIAQKLNPETPTRSELVQSVELILKTHNFSRAHYIGHSFGSILCTWMVHCAKNTIASVTFLDPVCFMLHHTNVLYEILYRPDRDIVDRIASYLVRCELFLQYYNRRHFWWFQNILFWEQLPSNEVPILVILSEDDDVVPVSGVRAYFEQCERKQMTKDDKRMKENLKDFRMHVLEEQRHGQFLISNKHWPEVFEKINGAINL